MRSFRRCPGDRSGATAVEYALIASLLAVAIIFGARQLGMNLGRTFNHIADTIAEAVGLPT